MALPQRVPEPEPEPEPDPPPTLPQPYRRWLATAAFYALCLLSAYLADRFWHWFTSPSPWHP